MTDRLSDEELENLLAECADQSPGPWIARWDGTLGRASVSAPNGLRVYIERPGYGNAAPEGPFIVRARTDLPAIIRELLSARKVVEAALRNFPCASSYPDGPTCMHPYCCASHDLCAALADYEKEFPRG